MTDSVKIYAPDFMREDMSKAKPNGEESLASYIDSIMSQEDLDEQQPEFHTTHIRNHVDCLVRSGSWLEVYSGLKDLLYSSSHHYNKFNLTVYLTELLIYPNTLSMKQWKPMMYDMLHLIQEKEESITSHILDCICHCVETYPAMMEDFKLWLLRSLVKRMKSRKHKTAMKVLRTLLAVLQLFKARRNRGIFTKILNSTGKFLQYSDQEIQLLSTKIFRAIARKCRFFPRGPTSWVIKEHFSSLLVKLHSSNPEISASAVLCINHCLPHLCWRTAGIELSGVYVAEAQRRHFGPRTQTANARQITFTCCCRGRTCSNVF